MMGSASDELWLNSESVERNRLQLAVDHDGLEERVIHNNIDLLGDHDASDLKL